MSPRTPGISPNGLSAVVAFAAVAAVPLAEPSEARADPPSFTAVEEHPEVDEVVIERLVEVEATENLLASAPVARDADGVPIVVAEGEAGPRRKIRFRITLECSGGETQEASGSAASFHGGPGGCEAQSAGQPPARIEALFKARQRNYRDWIGEILTYRLGRALGIRLTPTVERRFLRSELEAALAAAGPAYADLLEWEGEGDAEFVRGSLTYWVPGFEFRLGEFGTTPESFERIVRWMGHRNLEYVASQTLLGDLTAIFLLDYLVFNEDRHHNVGSVRRPGTDTLLLVAIDNGDSLYNPSRRQRRCKRWLWSVEVFPKDLVARLRALEPDAIRDLFESGDGGPSVETGIVDAVIDRRDRALARIDQLIRLHGDEILY